MSAGAGPAPTLVANQNCIRHRISPPVRGVPDDRCFMESENTDGWIASDHVVDVTQ